MFHPFLPTTPEVRRAGFTLLELLVVLAVIAVLAALLLPALGQARRQADSVRCVAQLGQMGTAIAAYAGEHDGLLPGPLTMAQGAVFEEGTRGSLARVLANYVGAAGGGSRTAAIFACLTAETKRQETRLGTNVGKLSSAIPPDDKKRLEQAGIDWRRFRDSNCRFIGDPKGTPPINLAYADCILNLTVGRSLEIERMVTMFAQQDEAMRAAAARNAAPAPAADAKK